MRMREGGGERGGEGGRGGKAGALDGRSAARTIRVGEGARGVRVHGADARLTDPKVRPCLTWI